MYPIQCAIMGGNLDLVKWLVEAHGCPLSAKPSAQSGILQSVQTSKSRTLIDLAMAEPPKIDILAYLLSKNLSVSDTNDSALFTKTLQTTMTLMSAGNEPLGLRGFSNNCCDASVATVEDDCIICCEQQMNFVLYPCGHQVCCSDCGNRLSECPLCRKTCKVMRIYKS